MARAGTASGIIGWILADGGTARYHDDPAEVSIDVAAGTVTAVPGDWIVRDGRGSFRPWRDDLLRAAYEPAGEPAAADRAAEKPAEPHAEADLPDGASRPLLSLRLKPARR